MFLFTENKRLASFFFRYLSTVPQTKALDTHQCLTNTGSNVILKPILIMLIVNIQEFIALSLQSSAVLCIAHTFKVHRNACCRE